MRGGTRDAQVSRRHAEVSLAAGEWIIRDLQSSNGLFVDARRTERAAIGDGVTVTVGAGGPMLQIEPEGVAPAPDRASETTHDGTLDDYAERYFKSEGTTSRSAAGP